MDRPALAPSADCKELVSPKPIRELAELLRYRRKLIGRRSSESNRPLKLLESVNIKLASIAANVFGSPA